MHRHRMKINDLTISYIDEGSGDTVVLIHGFCGSAGYFEKIIPELSEHYRVIAPSLRGHGKSSAVCDPYTIEDMASDVYQLLKQLELEKVTMVGHSLGGYVTLAFAEQYPDMLNGYSLLHSTAFPDSEEAKEGRNKNIELICENGIEPLINALIPKLFAPKHVKTLEDEVEHVREIGMNTSVTGAKGALKAMRDRMDRNEVLKNSKVPILLIAGEDDQIIPSEKVFSQSTPFIRTKTIKDAGHMGMLEAQEEVIATIEEFLNVTFPTK
ncbi:alpha/beta fold hydrolase [Bacillus suaedaesalsae]|uniref:Alpha/beta hydrolase n=1 Tax=Bacillus suaedaesalsae TaxID=2810349 RepID=A0ABS2DGH2_9BACI|nr:alpha/beta hydrolase [Bacillus suaedaesalsae]MBM6617560.1 alpha/beta hydrolase [Bacillus suaedaesalsae]